MTEKTTRAAPAINTKTASLRAELMDVAARTSDRGLNVLIHKAEELAREYPRIQCHVLTFPGGSRAVKGGVA